MTESLKAMPTQADSLKAIEELDRECTRHFSDKMRVEPLLSRQLVSFQANKAKANYRWYKFKEAFSVGLVEYLLCSQGGVTGRILDPFAGSGTTLFAASGQGMEAEGIELLPIGHQIIQARMTVEREFSESDFARLKHWSTRRPWNQSETRVSLNTIRITEGAYPPETHIAIERYMAGIPSESAKVRQILLFALLCVLESVSYTRQDGQFLRWDMRSGRKQGKRPFHKGNIPSFDEAIGSKLQEIVGDVCSQSPTLDLFETDTPQYGTIRLHEGSCLEVLPSLDTNSYDAVFTSPPYCNRYDYTRTYALELALLGVGAQELIQLRQQLLTCTVENRAKDLLAINPLWATAIEVADKNELLQTILRYLESEKEEGRLNNQGIPRMVRGYFYEMACVISDCARVLKSGAPLFMVNDNVRYCGANISVDVILSSMAQQLGFEVEHIFVLPNSKGNSSQQMGEHGRAPLRKCVYVWRKR